MRDHGLHVLLAVQRFACAERGQFLQVGKAVRRLATLGQRVVHLVVLAALNGAPERVGVDRALRLSMIIGWAKRRLYRRFHLVLLLVRHPSLLAAPVSRLTAARVVSTPFNVLDSPSINHLRSH